jgi:hypothetical protein
VPASFQFLAQHGAGLFFVGDNRLPVAIVLHVAFRLLQNPNDERFVSGVKRLSGATTFRFDGGRFVMLSVVHAQQRELGVFVELDDLRTVQPNERCDGSSKNQNTRDTPENDFLHGGFIDQPPA